MGLFMPTLGDITEEFSELKSYLKLLPALIKEMKTTNHYLKELNDKANTLLEDDDEEIDISSLEISK